MTTECCPLTSILFMRLSAFTKYVSGEDHLLQQFYFSRVPTSPKNHSYHTSSSFHLHRINPELIGAPVHVSNGYQHGEDSSQTISSHSVILEIEEIAVLNSVQEEREWKWKLSRTSCWSVLNSMKYLSLKVWRMKVYPIQTKTLLTAFLEVWFPFNLSFSDSKKLITGHYW